MPSHLNGTGNIFSAIRRNQELERQKRLAQRESFIDPAIQQVQGVRPLSVLSAIQLSRPVNVQSAIARPPTQRQQIARTNISPQQKNIQDLQRAFPPSVSSVLDRGTFRELEITKPTGERQNVVGTQALEDRLRTNIQGTGTTIRRKGIFDTVLSFLTGLGFR